MPMDLPVIEVIPLLREKLLTNRIVILQAPPGAGKSTVLPLHLLNEPWLASRKTVMMEPRRLAAKTVAQRLAQELGEPVGDTIGYRIRFESKTGTKTRLEVVTEGILTRKIQSDSSLEDVGLLIFDEFHERSLQADLALALSLQIQRLLREDLRILIMSATLDAEHLAKLLNAPVVTASGRQYPVTINYVAAESDKPVAMSVSVAIRKALRDESGDVLVFLPGSGEIRQTMKLLEEDVMPAVVVPLFGDLPFQEQQEAIMPRKDGKRKVVLATSIAETSLTIEGIRVVIDSGWSRLPRFDPSSGLTRLETVRVTRDAADQRAGRAGRLAAGVCHRLWTESTNRHLTAQRKPEILDADLAPVVLELRQWGVTDAASLPWITPPPPGAVSQAADVLEALEAIDAKGITPRGKEMVKLPTHPRIAHMLTLPGMTTSVKALAADVAAVLEERDPLDRGAGADLGLRVEALRRWRSGEKTSADRQGLMRIDRLSSQWRKFLDVEADNTAPDGFVIGRLITAAYPERIARQQSRQSDLYTLMNGLVIKLPPHDPLVHQPWICAAHVDSGKGQGKIFLASPVHEDD
ncbi:MAG: ATP-dependent helicase HrpB, partial [Cyclobacteriaceae bacterium]|nr:ATP-dependent helicase HrpB [Cyclobacteriaceae bacterium]